MACIFCTAALTIIAENEFAIAVADGFPVSPGHTLIIPKRHIASLFEATEEERTALFDLLYAMRSRLQAELKPNGFNIGINDGAAALVRGLEDMQAALAA